MLIPRFATVLAVIVFCLLLLGGIVHNTGSSLACPDWPLCYGSLLPEMKGGVAVEHSHRMLATSVGLMTIVLAVLLWRKGKEKPFFRRLGVLIVFLVVFQGLLGGITVLYRLPMLVSTAHLGTSFLFFSLIIFIAWRTSENWPSLQASTMSSGGRLWVRITAGGVYLQSLLGAFVRHSQSGLVCPDVPFCYGSPWPTGQGAITPMLQLQMAHRWLALGVAFMVFFLPILLRKEAAPSVWVKRLSILAPAIVILQIALGLLSVTTHLGVVAVTAHLGGAALLWAIMVSLTLLTGKAGRVAPIGERYRSLPDIPSSEQGAIA